MRRIHQFDFGDGSDTVYTAISRRDYRLLLRVARAADGLKYDSGVRVKWPDWLLPLEAALDALNARKGKP